MPAANQRLGEFILLDRIAVGAFGEVWRARHHAWSDQIVAVKIPTDPQFVRNLQKEGFAVQRFSHPCIVKAVSFDPYATPPYLVTEYVPGCSLRQLIHQGPMTTNDAAAVMKQVLAALHQAHRSGVVHRDIKPENILIHERATTSGLSTKGVVKLTDFGLGKTAIRSDQSIVFSEDQRDARRIVGSGPYMSPEQLDGIEVDAQTDLYACGVVLFEMLTGKRPAGAEMPSELNASVPKAMDEVFRRAFTRKERRFVSAEEFYNVIKAACEIPPADSVGVVTIQSSRNIVIGACAAAAAAIAIAVPIILYSSRLELASAPPSNGQPRQIAEAPTSIAEPKTIPPPSHEQLLAQDVPAPARDGQSPDSITTPVRVVDMLKLADVSRDTLSGHWALADGSLISDPQRPWSRFEFMYHPPAEYDYRVVFTRMDGDDIIPFILSEDGHQFALSIAGDHNKTCTFEDIDGKYINPSTRHSAAWIENGRRYTCVIKVRKDGISAFLDGALINEWKTDFSDMSLDGGWVLRRSDTLGVGNADVNRTVFYSIEVVEINDHGSVLSQVPDAKPEIPALLVATVRPPETLSPPTTPTTPEPRPSTFESLLAQMPKDAQPPWDEFSIPHAHKWLMEQIAGKELQMAVTIKNVEITRIPERGAPDETHEWDIWVTTDPVRTHAFNREQVLWPATWIADAYYDMSTHQYEPLSVPGFSWFIDSQLRMSATGGKIIVRANEDVAKRARTWRAGDTILLGGAVADVDYLRDPPSGRFNMIFEKHVRAIQVIPAGTQSKTKSLPKDQAIILDSKTP